VKEESIGDTATIIGYHNIITIVDKVVALKEAPNGLVLL
jgi:hypothetical protein